MRLVTLVVLAGAVATSAVAQQPPDYINCQDIRCPQEERILACSRTIDAASYGPATMTQVYLFRGIAHRNKGEFRQAMRDVREAQKISPNDQLVLTIAGGLLRDIGETDAAMKVLDAALGMRLMHAPSLFEVAQLEASRGNHKLAIEFFTGVEQIMASGVLKGEFERAYDTADVVNARGASWAALNERYLAQADFDEALRRNPLHAEARRNRDGLLSDCR